MDWFSRLTGFAERDYAATRSRLEVDGRTLRSRVNGRAYAIGDLDLVSLAELRARVRGADSGTERSTFAIVRGDVRRLHRDPANSGALFQVASQFNLLEMTGPEITPEHGVTRYAGDHTQGPACAIAAGAATIYRNYFVPFADGCGQSATRQLDALADLGRVLGSALHRPADTLWSMRNGYALCSADGLSAIGRYLQSSTEAQRDALRAALRIGVHCDVEVTDAPASCIVVSQAFCSALPVGYSGIPKVQCGPFARLILEAAYEATLWAAVANAARGRSNVVFLTRLGGGVFGNGEDWIDAAIARALAIVRPCGLDIRLVCFADVPASMRALQSNYARPADSRSPASPPDAGAADRGRENR